MNIILLSPPGGGKGTLAKQIIQNYNYLHISTGDILREEKNSNTQLGEFLRITLGTGNLVPDEIVNKIVETKLKTVDKPFLLDGYPRTTKQAEFLETITEIGLVIFLNVSDDIIIKRILERGKTSNRPDDLSEDIIQNRLRQYYSETMPLVDFYSNQNKLIVLNGEQSKEDVFKDFETILKNR
jgi:adenylate kinase